MCILAFLLLFSCKSNARCFHMSLKKAYMHIQKYFSNDSLIVISTSSNSTSGLYLQNKSTQRENSPSLFGLLRQRSSFSLAVKSVHSLSCFHTVCHLRYLERDTGVKKSTRKRSAFRRCYPLPVVIVQ